MEDSHPTGRCPGPKVCLCAFLAWALMSHYAQKKPPLETYLQTHAQKQWKDSSGEPGRTAQRPGAEKCPKSTPGVLLGTWLGVLQRVLRGVLFGTFRALEGNKEPRSTLWGTPSQIPKSTPGALFGGLFGRNPRFSHGCSVEASLKFEHACIEPKLNGKGSLLLSHLGNVLHNTTVESDIPCWYASWIRKARAKCLHF